MHKALFGFAALAAAAMVSAQAAAPVAAPTAAQIEAERRASEARIKEQDKIAEQEREASEKRIREQEQQAEKERKANEKAAADAAAAQKLAAEKAAAEQAAAEQAAAAKAAAAAPVVAAPAAVPLAKDKRERVVQICTAEAQRRGAAVGAADVSLDELGDTDIKSDGRASMAAKMNLVTKDSKGRVKTSRKKVTCETRNDVVTKFKIS